MIISRSGGIGRRDSLKNCWGATSHVGSSPTFGTIEVAELCSGSTGDFGSLSPGSNPGSAAILLPQDAYLQVVIMGIKENVQQLLNELPSGVELVAAAKDRTAEEVLQAVEAGVKIIGENYVQEAEKIYG